MAKVRAGQAKTGEILRAMREGYKVTESYIAAAERAVGAMLRSATILGNDDMAQRCKEDLQMIKAYRFRSGSKLIQAIEEHQKLTILYRDAGQKDLANKCERKLRELQRQALNFHISFPFST